MPLRPSALRRSNATIERLLRTSLVHIFQVSRSGESPMRTFIVACLAAAVIAVCAVVVLNHFQEPVNVAFTTSAVRI
jgi:riboflavin transporter FmnP